MTKVCPKCKTDNTDSAGFCQSCGEELKEAVTIPQNDVEPSSGVGGWWNKQSNGGKAAIGIVGICCIGLILIVAISGMFSPDKTTTTPSTTPSSTPSTTPSSTPAASTGFQPLTFSGTGDKATQSFNWPGGMMRIEMTHTGSSNFIIHLVDSTDGSTEEFVENEIGSVNGSRVFSIPAGSYLLDVQADGKWTVKISK